MDERGALFFRQVADAVGSTNDAEVLLEAHRISDAVEADAHPMHGHPYSLCLNLPPLGVLIFTADP